MKLYEKAPPGAKAESWVKANKARFKKRYGETAGERVLYAKAWKLFGEEVVDESKWNYPKELTRTRETSDMGTTNAAKNRERRKEWRKKIKAQKHAALKKGEEDYKNWRKDNFDDKETTRKVVEDTAPTNVMGASAADPNSPPIQGFSPMLHKKALKRKVKDVKLDRILALIRRGLK